MTYLMGENNAAFDRTDQQEMHEFMMVMPDKGGFKDNYSYGDHRSMMGGKSGHLGGFLGVTSWLIMMALLTLKKKR